MLNVLYCEHDATHRGDFVFDLPNGQETWLLLMTQTPAIFDVEGSLKQVEANSVVLYKPFQKIFYRAVGDRYCNDWIAFETDELFVLNSPIIPGVPFKFNNYHYVHKTFQLLTIEHEAQSRNHEKIKRLLLEALFEKLADHFTIHENSKVFLIADLQEAIAKNPAEDWNVQKMANMLNMSVGHMESLYREKYNVSCMQDVINQRIRLAKEYLLNTMHNVSEIAQACGYKSPEHFFRQFKKATGVTPVSYRRQNSKKNF